MAANLFPYSVRRGSITAIYNKRPANEGAHVVIAAKIRRKTPDTELRTLGTHGHRTSEAAAKQQRNNSETTAKQQRNNIETT